MIHIERLTLRNIGKYTWQTFVDHLLGTKDTRIYNLEKYVPNKARSFISTDILSSQVISKLKNISIGKYYGLSGIDIDILISDPPSIENLVIEISVDFINALPKHKLKYLLENYIVILNDFEEGGTLYGYNRPHLLEILSSRNIKPKLLFLVGSCFQLNSKPSMNIYKIPFEYWAVSTAVINENFSRCIFDKNIKQKMIDELTQYSNKFCAVPMFKPKKSRVELLLQLEKCNMLDKVDWSLAYGLQDHNYTPTVQYSKRQTYTEEQEQFLSKYDFPKFIDSPHTNWKDMISPLSTWFNLYKFQVCSETYLGDEYITSMGNVGFLTEKTYKSFMTGAVPIMYAPNKSIEHLKSYGFKLIDDFDTTDPVVVCKIISDSYINDNDFTDIKIHNFEHITDINFLTSLICEPLEKIAELINSIRR